jgi:hypothetical protein
MSAAAAVMDAPMAPPAEPCAELAALLPLYDFGSRHVVEIAAPAARVWEAIEQYAPSHDGSALVRLLFRLRGFTPRPTRLGLRAGFARTGFRVLAERPGVEIVFGIAGRFWRLDEPAALTIVADAGAFRAYGAPGAAKAAMSLHVEALGPARTRLTTATRVRCSDRAAYYRFALYWGLIKPASGWIRREMLRAVAHRAESGAP